MHKIYKIPQNVLHSNLLQVKSIILPFLSIEFQNKIEFLVKKGHAEKQKSQELYKQAESILLTELGLENWQAEKRKINIGTLEIETTNTICEVGFKEVLNSNRIDAEFFEPKYFHIIEKIKNYKNGCSIIQNEFVQNNTSFKKIKEQNYKYVEIGSVDISNGSITPLYLIGSELPQYAKIKLQKRDLIISKVRTYRGAVSIINENDFVGSGAFVVLHEISNINIETLYVFLKSKPILELTFKFNKGTSYPILFDKDILNFPFPLIHENIQQIIKTKVNESQQKVIKSKRLLDFAKQILEKYIETDEKQAEILLNELLKEK